MHSLTSTAGEASRNLGVTIIKIEKRSDSYARIDNRTLRDEHLSLKATGLLAVLLSLPPHWKVNVRHLAQMKADGLHAVQTGLDELERYSYAKYERLKDSRGRFCSSVWRIFERPFTGKAVFPCPENPGPGEIRFPEKSAPINDRDICTNKRERIKKLTADGKASTSSAWEHRAKELSCPFVKKSASLPTFAQGQPTLLPADEILLDKPEIARRLKKSVRTVDARMKARRLPYIKVGRSVMFRWGTVLEKLDTFRVN